MSTNQFRRYLDLLNEADLVPPNTNVALPSSGTFSNDQAIANLNRQMSGGSESRCAVCGTPQSQHQQLQHQFVAGNDTQPAPVAQGGQSSGGDVGRIKQLQAELKSAGANLGATGPNRDGIDGDIGPLTTAAMTKYPQISAKYADISGAPTPSATPAVDTSKLTSALTAIEGILSKYKVNLREDRKSSTPADQMKQWQSLMELTQADMDAAAAKRTASQAGNQSKINARYAADAQAKKIGPYYSDTPAQAMPYSQAAQRPLAGTASAAKTGAAKAEKGLLKGAGKMAGKAVPFVGTGLSVIDAYNRWQAGDKTGAVISALAGAGWLVPGPAGWVLGGGLDAYNLYRGDQTGSQAVSSEDVAAIQQNLKIINDWSQVPENAASITPELKSRIADATAAGVALTKQAAPTPAATPTPATTVPPNLDATLDKLDKLLKKNNFESIKFESLSESEQLARYRDIVNEGGKLDTAVKVGKWVGQNVIAPSGKWVGQNVIAPSAKYVGAAMDPIVKTAIKGGTAGGIGFGAWKAWEYMQAPNTMSAQDQAEFNSLIADYKKMVPDQATFDALDPAVQEKFKQLAIRIKKAQEGTQ